MLSAHASRGTALKTSGGDRFPRLSLALLFVGALVALLARTLFVTFQLRHTPDGMRGQGWWLGLVLAAGELFAVLELTLYAARIEVVLSTGPVSLFPTARE